MRLQLAATICLALALLYPSTGSVAALAGDDSEPQASGFDVVGELPLFEAYSTEAAAEGRDGNLIINPTTRRGYQLFNRGSITVIWSFDLDTLQPIRRRALSFSVGHVGISSRPGDRLHAVDEEGGRLFLGDRQGGKLRVHVIDEELFESLPEGDRGFVLNILSIPEVHLVQLTGRDPYGLSFHTEGEAGKLLILWGSADLFLAGRPIHDHWLSQWDVETGAGDWVLRLEVCQNAQLVGGQSWSYQLAILRGESNIYLGCQAGHGRAQAVQIPLDGSGHPHPDQPPRGFPIARTHGNVLADVKGERLVFMADLNGITWWFFDGKSGSWVGSVGAALWSGFDVGGGLDPESGRLYSLIPNHERLTSPPQPVSGGLKFTDSRLTPVSQLANAVPALAASGQFRIVVDPKTPDGSRHVFVRRGSRIAVDKPEGFYTVVRDAIPVAEEPPLSDLDRNTLDVDEELGITGANYDVSSSGFGARVLLIGGFNALISRDLDGPHTGECYQRDRELHVGGVESAQLSNNVALSRAVSLRADEGTKIDGEHPTGRCAPLSLGFGQVDALIGQPWSQGGDGGDDYTAACVGDAKKARAPHREGRRFYATATCKESEGLVEASSEGSLGSDLLPQIWTGYASSSVTLKRGSPAGAVATVDSVARGVTVEGVGHIGVIRTTAIVKAAGRPGTALTTFERQICGVQVVGFQQSGCLSPDQQIQFVAALNRALGRNGEARLRNPDPEYQEGTPGGYIAGIFRDRREEFSDQLISRDTSKTVPGLEIIFYRADDPSRGPGRQIYQFAGVEASAAYGIDCLFGLVDGTDDDECVRPTAELRVSLTDLDLTPLPGGVFAVHHDVAGDGILDPLDDGVVELGEQQLAVCTTADDGVGDCAFQLPPGSYLVRQQQAPAGYAPAPDCPVTLEPFIASTCHFSNVPAVGFVGIFLTDDSGEPLGAGTFDVLKEPVGTTATVTEKVASCITNDRGFCLFDERQVQNDAEALVLPCAVVLKETPDGFLPDLECPEEETLNGADEATVQDEAPVQGEVLLLPLGVYTIMQTSAPLGFLPAPDENSELSPLTLLLFNPQNGQEGEEAIPPQEAVAGSAITRVILEGNEGVSSPRPVVTSAPLPPPTEESPLVRVVRAPAEAFKFLLRQPREAALFASMCLLLLTPLWIAFRRRSLSSMGGAN